MATVFLVVCFAYIFVTAPTTYAAEANWSGDDISYQQNTYTDLGKATGLETHKLPKDTHIYRYVEAANTSGGGATQKAHLIYFPSGTDPTTATTASYRTYDLIGANLYSNPSQVKQLSLSPQPASATINPGASSCEVDGVGWIVCSMSRWIADGVDYLYGIISKFFIVQPLTSTSPTNSMYDLWQAVRNVANVAFVIAFLVIIYSQITSNAMSNYTIKKMVPRIIVAAILVNTSYWICAAAIDVSNILGIAIQDLFINLRGGVGAATFDMPKWQDVTAGILSGTGVVVGGAALLVATGGTIGGLVFLLLGALLPAIFAALVAVAILAARQAIITLFVIIAPLAFVAYLLPNTEDWFNRWRKLFMTALLMFPAFSLIFGAAQLAGVVIIQNAHGDISIALLGLTVQVVPLFVTPFLIKLSSGLLGTIAGMANDRSKGVFDRAKGWTNNNRELHRQRGFSARPRQGVGRFRPTNVARGLNNRTLSREQRTAGYKSLTEGNFTQTRAGRRVYNLNQDAGLEKQAGEESNFRSYKQAMATGTDRQNTRRRHIHHQAHVDKGFGDIYEESMTNQAELDLRGQVARNVGGIGDVKVQADVDAGLAEQKKKLVASQGQLALKRTIEGDRALSHEVQTTTRFEKQAAEYDTIVQKAAEAAYDNYSRTNQAAQNLRLQSTVAEQEATEASEKMKSFISNMKAVGDKRDDAGNLIVRDLDTTNAALAASLKQVSQNIAVEGLVQSNAEIVGKGNLMGQLKTNMTLRNYAGGVDIDGDAGATRVLAKARSELVSTYIESVKNSRSLLSEYSAKELIKLSQHGRDRDNNDVSKNTALRDAAQQEILLTKGNNWALQKEKDYVAAEYGMHYNEESTQRDASGQQIRYFKVRRDAEGNAIQNPDGSLAYDAIVDANGNIDQDKVDRNRDAQQMFVDGVKNSKLKLASISGTDKSDMETGTFVWSGKQAIVRDARDGKIKPDRWATMDYDEMMRTVQLMRDSGEGTMRGVLGDDKLDAMAANINTALTDPRLNVHLEDRQIKVLQALQSYAREHQRDLTRDEKIVIEGTDSRIPRNYDYRTPYEYTGPTGPA